MVAGELQASFPRWPSIQVGRSLLSAPSPQPILGFYTKTSLISDLLLCMRSFWVLGIEPSCSTRPYSVLQGPMLGSSWGTCFQEPSLLSKAQGRCL